MGSQRVTRESPTDPLTAERVRALLDYDPETGVFRWRLKTCRKVVPGAVAGTFNGKGLLLIGVDGHRYVAARLAWLWMTGEWPKGQIACRNLDPGNIRWANLCDVSASEKVMTTKPPANNTSGVRGVCWARGRGQWNAYIGKDGRRITLGHFDRFSDAVAARRCGEAKYFGSSVREAASA